MRLSDQEYNRLLLLKKVRTSEPVARIDLVGLTGLTGGTITAITADLVKRGIVIEEKVASSAPGRPGQPADQSDRQVRHRHQCDR
ncbi:hypothetical protein [Novosphingobium sp. ST904]|uniref:hypothetical protein n=1 Tax=Novosphingobium sp. ST904 TaxID=1684385 RepID=UPI000AD86B57|nr:hypothetical protein [Novosphingobium sp. ST904]